MKINIDDYITVSQAAKLLICSRQNILKLVKENKLPAIRIGIPWYIKRAAVEERFVMRQSPADALNEIHENIRKKLR